MGLIPIDIKKTEKKEEEPKAEEKPKEGPKKVEEKAAEPKAEEQKKITIALYKPKGYMTTRSDPKNRKTVMSLLPKELKGLKLLIKT